MTRVPWATFSSVGDQSEYVTQMGSVIIPHVIIIKKMLREETIKYFRSFCDKFSEMILTRLHANVFRCKPISEIGSEQVLFWIRVGRFAKLT